MDEYHGEERRKRMLTDGDVEALTASIRDKVIREFYQDLGKGVWGLVWRSIVIVLIGIAAYGAVHNGHN